MRDAVQALSGGFDICEGRGGDGERGDDDKDCSSRTFLAEKTGCALGLEFL